MSKNIVLLSDGTGNSSKALLKTNVWRLFQVLDLRDPKSQIAFYDDGVGTSPFRLFAILGGIFGFGLKRNVIALYSFCSRNYVPGDRIYCFGFSRGAFTIRIVAGMIAHFGLITYFNNEEELAHSATDVYRDYRRRLTLRRWLFPSLFDVYDEFILCWHKLRGRRRASLASVDSIHFVGVWDTVGAYGGPIQEITRTIDYWIWPLSMPDRFMNAKIHRACHALSLDDERDAFHPVIWDQRYVRGADSIPGERKTEWLFDINYHAPSLTGQPLEIPPHHRIDLLPIDRERISQVWFAGVHADVGGGYAQNGLSYVTLDWMLDRARAYGLRLLEMQREQLVNPHVNPFDKLNDSRRGLAAYYRYKPRNIAEIYSEPTYKPATGHDWSYIWALLRGKQGPETEILGDLHPSMPQTVASQPPPLIHESVFDRITWGTDCYAPLVLPASYGFTDEHGKITYGFHPLDPGLVRVKIQDRVWNWIWLRRVVYFLTVFATAFVAFIPFFVIYAPGFGLHTVGGFVNPLVNAGAAFLPGFLEPWVVAFRNAPGFVLIGGCAVTIFLIVGDILERRIRDLMRIGWHSPMAFPNSGWQAIVYWLRRQGWYRAFFYVLKNWLVPTGVFLQLLVFFGSSLGFAGADAIGLICKPTGHAIDVTEEAAAGRKSVGYANIFYTREICHPTGLRVTHDESYEISLTIPENDPWIDRDIPADPSGFVLGGWRQLGGIPFKRLVWSNWFRPIIRVGSTGLEEHVPEFVQDSGDKTLWTARFTARSDGEVFVYVNDTSIFFPWLYRIFYDNNRGSATISMKRL